MRVRVLRRPIVFLGLHCSICVHCIILILLINLFIVAFVRCSVPHCKWISAYTGLVWLILVKVRIGGLSLMLLGTWLFCGKRCGESSTLLTEIHEILPLFFTFFRSDLDQIWFRWCHKENCPVNVRLLKISTLKAVVCLGTYLSTLSTIIVQFVWALWV